MEDLNLSFENAMNEAAFGKKTWISLAERYGLGQTGAALLLPKETPEYHEYSVALLPEYMKKTGLCTGVILYEAVLTDSPDGMESSGGVYQGQDIPDWLKEMIGEGVVKMAENEGIKGNEEGAAGIYLHFLLKEEMDALLRFYSFYEFTDRLIIGSLKLPAGRQGAGMVGRKGLTLREAVGAMLYDIYL